MQTAGKGSTDIAHVKFCMRTCAGCMIQPCYNLIEPPEYMAQSAWPKRTKLMADVVLPVCGEATNIILTDVPGCSHAYVTQLPCRRAECRPALRQQYVKQSWLRWRQERLSPWRLLDSTAVRGCKTLHLHLHHRRIRLLLHLARRPTPIPTPLNRCRIPGGGAAEIGGCTGSRLCQRAK